MFYSWLASKLLIEFPYKFQLPITGTDQVQTQHIVEFHSLEIVI